MAIARIALRQDRANCPFSCFSAGISDGVISSRVSALKDYEMFMSPSCCVQLTPLMSLRNRRTTNVIFSPDKVHEIKVDAGNGSILRMDVDSGERETEQEKCAG